MSARYGSPIRHPVKRSARELKPGDFICRVNGSGIPAQDVYGWGKVSEVTDVSERYSEYESVLCVHSETPHVAGETVRPDAPHFWVWTDERSPWSSSARASDYRYQSQD